MNVLESDDYLGAIESSMILRQMALGADVVKKIPSIHKISDEIKPLCCLKRIMKPKDIWVLKFKKNLPFLHSAFNKVRIDQLLLIINFHGIVRNFHQRGVFRVFRLMLDQINFGVCTLSNQLENSPVAKVYLLFLFGTRLIRVVEIIFLQKKICERDSRTVVAW